MEPSIILTLPYAYTVSYVEPRKRNPTKRNLRAETPVEVACVTGDEAPVAFEMILPSGLGDESGEGTRSVSARSHGGRLYARLGSQLPVERFQQDVLKPASTWRTRFFARNEHTAPAWSGDDYPRLPLLARESFTHRNPMGLPDFEELAVHVAGERSKLRFKSSDREDREAEARTILSRGILVIDGEVWSDGDAREPHWTVRCGADGAHVDWSFSDDPLWYVSTFRIDRKDEALEFAHRLAREAGVPGKVKVADGRLARSEPTLLAHDDVVSVARQALSGLMGRSSNRAAVEPWSAAADEEDLRVHAFSAQGLTPETAVEALQSISRLCEELSALPEGLRGSTARSYLERAAPAMHRWEADLRHRPDVAAIAEGLDADASALRLI